ncbi:MAG: ABC transporter substrate-binding protein [Candidatus Nanopelagicales bacterium]
MSVLQTNNRRGAGLIAGGAAAFLAVSGAVTVGANAAPAPAPAAKTTASCAPAEGVDAGTVKLGFISSFTGPNAPGFAGSWEAVQLRVGQENAKGGINGRKIVLSKYDDNSNGATQITAVNQALERDHVLGLMNIVNAETMFPILAKSNVPTIGLSLPPTGVFRNAFGAAGTQSSAYTTTAGAKRMKEAGATTIATVAFPVPAAIAAANGFAATLPLVGLKNGIAINDAPFGAYDATSTALKLKQSGADGVYLVLQVDGGMSVMSAFKQQGVVMKAPYLAGLSDPVAIAKTNGGLDGAIGATYGTVPAGVNRPGFRTYEHGMLAAGFNPYGPNPPSAYVATDTMIKGLKLAGLCPTRDAVVNQLRKQKKITGAGLLPAPISYAPGLTPNGDPARCTWFITVQSGKMVPDKAPTCGDYVEVATGKIVQAPK